MASPQSDKGRFTPSLTSEVTPRKSDRHELPTKPTLGWRLTLALFDVA
jgi:hypothetical protein